MTERKKPALMSAPRDGDTAHWAPRAEELLLFLQSGPKTWAEVYQWARCIWSRAADANSRHLIAWSESRGMVVYGQDKRWRSTRVSVSAAASSSSAVSTRKAK